MSFLYKRLAYRCDNAVQPHGFQLNYWEMPPERCPRCNATVHRISANKLQDTIAITVFPMQLIRH
jgi:uncharacterized paraquat-inducible protein A